MTKKIKVGCGVKPENLPKENIEEKKIVLEEKKEERKMVMVGRKAPDFKAQAFHKGEFVEVNLSDYAGKWVLLCFYPGDFTFV